MPPNRPRSMDDLGFTMRKPVEWFSPPILARAGAKVVLSAALGDYLDKREMQLSIPAGVVRSPAGDEEVWVDFIADTGDGFDASYSVAWCASQRTLRPDGFDDPDGLPRADFVVFGGDEVYPYATPKEYEDRFIGPFAAALPWTDAPHPKLLAIPGNHDWYDGLTGFMRVFAQPPGWIGGRQLAQTRSYFAVDLPGPYWLWGIDISNDAYVDASQIAYFLDAADEMEPGDRLILCTAKPSWTGLSASPDGYRNLNFVERRLVPPGVETILMLSGDKHYYARHERVNTGGDDASRRVKITAGGGGAFLSATQLLEEVVHIPTNSSPDADPNEPATTTEPYRMELAYPERRRSRRLCWRALGVGWFNPVFLAVPALLNVLLFAANTSGLRTDGTPIDELAEGWSYGDLLTGGFRSPATIALLLTLWALLAAFFDVPKRFTGPLSRLQPGPAGYIYRGVVGLLHTVGHVFAHALVALVAIELCSGLDGIWFVLAAGALVAIGGGLLGSLVFGIYLVLALNLLGRHETEAFSAFRYEGCKNFLRMRISPSGVTIYPIGIDRSERKWEVDPDASEDDASLIRPAGGSVATKLIEAPITLR